MTTLGTLFTGIIGAILTIVVLTYFLSKWILGQLKLGNEKNRKFISSILAIIFSPLICVGLIIVLLFIESYHPKEEFSKEKWDNNIEKRYVMSKDIMKNKILIGKTKDEVIELLGDGFREHNEKHISYYLGYLPGMSLDPDILEIFFENDRVVKVSQRST